MPGPRRCPQCGALQQHVAARSCEFCGYELAKPEPVPAAPVPVEQPVGLPARFEQLKSHPGLPELLAFEPSMAGRAASEAFGIFFMLIFAVVAIFILFFFFRVAGPDGPPIWIVPIAIVGFAMFTLVAKITRASRISSAPLERELALVVDKRTEITGSNDTMRTSYHATLERADGRRAEYATDGRVSGLITRGDMGVAYTKAELLLDFRRLSS